MNGILNDTDSAWVANVVMNRFNERFSVAFEQLKPRIFPDGNQWCCLYGENIQSGICGFGDTPALAAMDWDKNFYNQKLNPVK